MNDANMESLRQLAADFRTAIERARADKASGALVGLPTAFHQSLSERVDEDAAHSLATLSAEETGRLERQLEPIESRLTDLSRHPPDTR